MITLTYSHKNSKMYQYFCFTCKTTIQPFSKCLGKVDKNTPVVKLGVKKASNVGVLFSIIPSILLSVLYNGRTLFFISAILSGALFLITGILFKYQSSGKNTYFNLKYNFAALSASQASLVCYLGQDIEGFVLAICSITGVLSIFSLGYNNEKL